MRRQNPMINDQRQEQSHKNQEEMFLFENSGNSCGDIESYYILRYAPCCEK